MLCIAGPDGYFRSLNPAWDAPWASRRGARWPALPLLRPPRRPRGDPGVEFQNLLVGGEAIAFENRYRCKDGIYSWLLWNAIPLPVRRQIYAVAHDITAQGAEAALRRTAADVRSNEQLKQLADDLSEVALSEHQAHERLASGPPGAQAGPEPARPGREARRPGPDGRRGGPRDQQPAGVRHQQRRRPPARRRRASATCSGSTRRPTARWPSTSPSCWRGSASWPSGSTWTTRSTTSTG